MVQTNELLYTVTSQHG